MRSQLFMCEVLVILLIIILSRIADAFLLDKIIISNLENLQHYPEKFSEVCVTYV